MTTVPAAASVTVTKVAVIDTDIHVNPRSVEELQEYMPNPWRAKDLHKILLSSTVPTTSVVYNAPNEGRRLDAFGPSGPPGSDPEFTAQQLFHEAGVDYAICIPLIERAVAHPDHEAALAATANQWQAETWLSAYNKHERYRGSIKVGRDPRLAVDEIERWAGHPYFVQVMINPVVIGHLGNGAFDPVLATAERHGLPVAMHLPLEHPGQYQLTPYGPQSYFFEVHGVYPLRFAAHLASLIGSGTFERFPNLRVALVECGFAWVIPFLWRLDNQYAALPKQSLHLRRRPSEYVEEHVRFTRQPVEEPRDPRKLAELLRWNDASRLVMFATDYPHWDGDYNPRARFAGVDDGARDRILRTNAIEFYGFPSERAISEYDD